VEEGVVNAYEDRERPLPGNAVLHAQQGKKATKKEVDSSESDDDDDDSDEDSTGNKTKRSKYKVTTVPKVWWAKLSNHHEKVVTKEELVALFGSKFAAEVLARGKSDSSSTKYIDVPVGAVREARLCWHLT
jgi:hypothetical protein